MAVGVVATEDRAVGVQVQRAAGACVGVDVAGARAEHRCRLLRRVRPADTTYNSKQTAVNVLMGKLSSQWGAVLILWGR